jgi:hypothetical protein
MIPNFPMYLKIPNFPMYQMNQNYLKYPMFLKIHHYHLTLNFRLCQKIQMFHLIRSFH